MVRQPIVETGEDRGGAILPDGQSSGGILAADIGFNGVEIADEDHAFLGNRRTRELVSLWGADRVMFGSDFPMWDPVHEYDTFTSLGFSDDQLEDMLWHNAERFTGVKVS